MNNSHCLCFILCTEVNHNGKLGSMWSCSQICQKLTAFLPKRIPSPPIRSPTTPYATTILLSESKSCMHATQIRHGDAPVRSQLELRSCCVIETCDQAFLWGNSLVQSKRHVKQLYPPMNHRAAYIKCNHNSSGSWNREGGGKNTNTYIYWCFVFIRIMCCVELHSSNCYITSLYKFNSVTLSYCFACPFRHWLLCWRS